LRRLVVVAAVVLVATGFTADATVPPRPRGLTTYGRTVWNLEALLHDTFGSRQVCMHLRTYSFGSTCGSFADDGYWRYTFASARHSRFRLVRRKSPPALGNVQPLRVRGLYVFCGDFPSVGYYPYRSTRKWLVLQHGSADLPLTCS
jgi:hypothetical protein